MICSVIRRYMQNKDKKCLIQYESYQMYTLTAVPNCTSSNYWSCCGPPLCWLCAFRFLSTIPRYSLYQSLSLAINSHKQLQAVVCISCCDNEDNVLRLWVTIIIWFIFRAAWQLVCNFHTHERPLSNLRYYLDGLHVNVQIRKTFLGQHRELSLVGIYFVWFSAWFCHNIMYDV